MPPLLPLLAAITTSVHRPDSTCFQVNPESTLWNKPEVATVRVEAWQDDPDRLVAIATGTFAVG